MTQAMWLDIDEDLFLKVVCVTCSYSLVTTLQVRLLMRYMQG